MHRGKISKAKDIGVRFAEAEETDDLEERIEEILEELGDREVKEIQYEPMVHDLSMNYKAGSISHYTAMIIYKVHKEIDTPPYDKDR